MKKIIIFLFIVLFVVFIFKNQKKTTKSENITNQIVEKINEKNKLIKNIKLNISIRQNLLFANGFIKYEKENNFNMICNSFFGKELEIGSNKDYFWFWTRKENILYFCKHTKIKNTRIKSIFYPCVLKSFLGLDEFYNYEIFENKIIEKLPNGLKKITIINDDKIIGHELYEFENLVLKSKVLKYEKDFPKKIEINYISENIVQYWETSNIIFNIDDLSKWEIPNYKNKIDLENY